MSVDLDRVKELFFAAMDLPEEDVGRFLDQACGGDLALRAEVVSLLGFHDGAELVEDSATAVSAVMPTILPVLADPPPSDPAVESRYREISLLGVGGCGRVTRTYDRRLRRVVAHKQLSSERDDLRRMLIQEARLLAYLDHPGVVQVFDCDDASYTMGVVDGETLKERARRDPLGVGEIVRIVTRIAETMANAHAKGVMHLDLKPANVILQPFGQVSIIDWGLARFHDIDAYRRYLQAAGESAAPEESAWEGVAGTPSYMPVEQALGEELTPAADVFALGTILYELVTGALPFERAPTLLAVLAKAHVQPKPLATFRADVPARLDALCLRMLSANPASRPASFDEVLAELEALNGGAQHGEIRELAPGEVLFREGEVAASAYQILSGTLQVTVQGPDGPTEIARRSVGELIGELSILSQAPRSATVMALEPSRVAVVTPDRIEAELEKANPLIAKMVRSLSDRLRQEAGRGR